MDGGAVYDWLEDVFQSRRWVSRQIEDSGPSVAVDVGSEVDPNTE